MQTFSDHCAHLGCPLNNVRRSWCALSQDRQRAVFTIWSDEMDVKRGQYVLFPITERQPGEIPRKANHTAGGREVFEIASYCADHPDVEVLGVLCGAEDTEAIPRQRKEFDDRIVFRMSAVRGGERIVANVVDRVPVASVVDRQA